MKLKRILLAVGFLVSSAYAQKYVEYQKPKAGDDVIGELVYVTPKKHESLVDLTIRHEMGYDELRWANPGINAWMLNENQPLVLPTQFILPEGKRSGIVSNIPEMRTYYFLEGSDKVYVYPVGVGRMDWKTPLGSWSITRKQENPAWYPPESIRREHVEMGRGTLPSVVPAGPDNPLGTRVLRLALPSYLLHGTNDETGIGMRVTHGCMRFYPQHIEHLYDMVPTNTMVTFLNQPVKYGFSGNDIMIEVHPPLEEDNLSVPALKEQALKQLAEFIKPYPNASINYDMVNLAVQQQTGIPIIIGEKVSHIPTKSPANIAGTSSSIELMSSPEMPVIEVAPPVVSSLGSDGIGTRINTEYSNATPNSTLNSTPSSNPLQPTAEELAKERRDETYKPESTLKMKKRTIIQESRLGEPTIEMEEIVFPPSAEERRQQNNSFQ
ncbi:MULTISPECIES: L,D-transpeptidase family protein [Ignatzschineria]|uniref:L,D-TPase catalytic domain-containing protein n=1 Tax=Ignatzschineria cameli TaxID=2182793 RepID=A0A2U2ATD7_9GAMM|nr:MULTISPECIES: L,D-transpeptidase family protein [Ignatzschineria]OYQ78783.1 hypothetical protein B9T19_08045 [Ignatzschineria sp. F8392]PWD87512.1 hypothetical protein DC080_01460 [Ignatzschineria cameli]PWD87988.1 hypothetical protein DC077_01535 [Ignatzschineria cameli]PWD91020.1 hypothetical protein DC079_02290 [Ignatzschineria cameli]PWD92662.1 hypothetical protein DC081_02290 [Ignatzschineria cameli]